MDKAIQEITGFTAHELISSYHDGLREATDFVQSQVIGTLTGQINLSKQEKAIMGTFYPSNCLLAECPRENLD